MTADERKRLIEAIRLMHADADNYDDAMQMLCELAEIKGGLPPNMQHVGIEQISGGENSTFQGPSP